MNTTERAEEYLDSLIVDDRRINFDAYLHPNEIAKLKDASSYFDEVKSEILDPTHAQGARLPWQKAGAFRFRPSELTIWSGYSGHKKSLLLGFVMVGFMAQGQKCCVASMEMPPRKTLMRMCKQWVGNSDPSMQYVEKFFDWCRGKLWLYDQVGTVKADKLVAVVRYAAAELGVQHFVIDSLMMCGVSVEELDRQKRFINELASVAKDTGCHVHLVAHARKPAGDNEREPSTKYGVKGASEITDMADNVLIVFVKKPEDENQNGVNLTCEKQRHGESEPKFLLNFDDNGLQFKSFASASRYSPDEWGRNTWT